MTVIAIVFSHLSVALFNGRMLANRHELSSQEWANINSYSSINCRIDIFYHVHCL